MSDKHLVYAEDILWAIMQHPSSKISKSIVKQIIDSVVSEKQVQHQVCSTCSQEYWEDAK